MTQTATTAAHRDNLLGICHAIGEDWGFNPLFLRLALAVTLLLDYQVALAAYAICGLSVLVSRGLTRSPRRQAATAATAPRPLPFPIPETVPTYSAEARVPELVG